MKTFKELWKEHTDLQKNLVKTREELNKFHFQEFLEFSLKSVKNDLIGKYFQKTNEKIFKILDVTWEIIPNNRGFSIFLHTETGLIPTFFRTYNVPENLHKSLTGNFKSLSEVEFKKIEKERIKKEIDFLQKQLKELN